MIVKVHLNKLILKTKFSISHGDYAFRYSFVVELQENSISGFGETVVIDYYDLTLEGMVREINLYTDRISAWNVELTTTEFYNFLLKLYPNSPFVRCAFDTAYWDLKARLEGKSLRNYISIDTDQEPLSSITIGANEDASQVSTKLNQEWPIYKLKFKTDERIQLIRKLRKKQKNYGIDANGGLNLKNAQLFYNQMIETDGLYFEQPFAKNKDQLILQLSRTQHLPILADESVTDIASLERLIDLYDGFVLKLTKMGGITPVLEMIDLCKKYNKLTLAGCMTESSVGISNMYALLPLFDYADLDGAYLISNDPYTGYALKDNGKITHSSAYLYGNGIEINQK